jgi:hypothetical protein
MPHTSHENSSQSHLYSEFLPNIRSVSVFGRLSSPVNSQTEAAVNEDGSSVSIKHEGRTLCLSLPVKVIPSPIPALQDGRNPNSPNISIRLQPEQEILRALLDLGDENYDPWNAAVLRDCKSISCFACGTDVVSVNGIEAWKDLPSANWAEMMDFWHCHKPVDQPNSTSKNEEAENKGYSAINAFSAPPGTGFVDATSLVLNPRDCQLIKVCRL